MQHTLNINYDAKMDMLRDEILDLVQQMGAQQTGTYQIDPLEFDTQEIALRTAQLSSLRTKLEVFPKEHHACIQQNRVIESLYFEEIRRRWNQIPHADEASNAWVFDNTLTPFNHWLSSKEASDGLFCITGRVCYKPVVSHNDACVLIFEFIRQAVASLPYKSSSHRINALRKVSKTGLAQLNFALQATTSGTKATRCRRVRLGYYNHCSIKYSKRYPD